MNQMAKHVIIEELYNILERKLPAYLSYHGIHHTRDVHDVCKFYIELYDIHYQDALLLEIAAAGHDIGFIHTYKDHERMGATIVKKLMERHNFDLESIQTVSNLILSTRCPQVPTTLMERILCDADLDYLGRRDFTAISQTLKKEWSELGIFQNLDQNFDKIQINFLKSHRFHTDYARRYRKPLKERHLTLLCKQDKKRSEKTSYMSLVRA